MSNARDIADAGHQLAAWVNFNGMLDENSGSLTAGENVLIRASFNVSSCQYNGTGNYTVNFATAMPDTNYVFLASASSQYTNSLSLLAGQDSDDTKSTTQIKFSTLYNNASTASADDSPNVNVSIFR